MAKAEGRRMMNRDRWLSVDEIAEHLGVKRDTVYAWIRDKALPSHRVGRLWKFKRAAVDRWVESGRAGETGKRNERPT